MHAVFRSQCNWPARSWLWSLHRRGAPTECYYYYSFVEYQASPNDYRLPCYIDFLSRARFTCDKCLPTEGDALNCETARGSSGAEWDGDGGLWKRQLMIADMFILLLWWKMNIINSNLCRHCELWLLEMQCKERIIALQRGFYFPCGVWIVEGGEWRLRITKRSS